MEQKYRLRKNGQFRYVYRKGKGGACRELAAAFVRGPRLMVGFSVGKKVGNAVTRNKVKRRLRAAFREEIPSLKTGLYVITARESAAKATYGALRASMRYLLRKQEMYRVPKP